MASGPSDSWPRTPGSAGADRYRPLVFPPFSLS
jgi:hypothetical protein